MSGSSVVGYPRRQRDLERLLDKMGLADASDVDWRLLNLALTHPTASAEANYEQLEFVGDAVVRIAAAELLWEVYPEVPVGEMAAVRSVLVSDRVLAGIADTYNLERYLLMAGSAAGDRDGRQSRLADALEAVVGALYLSRHNLQLVRPWLDEHFRPAAEQVRADPARQNYKAALQEWTQAHYKALPEYRVEEIRKRHGDRERFMAQVWFMERCLGTGRGRSRKAAEQASAREAFLALQNLVELPPIEAMPAPEATPGDAQGHLPENLPGNGSNSSDLAE
ncbi:MAG: ribonuclease III [Cyanobacteria bacterium]|nr:ribonuclease III [Cyanobacteriota bacterium]